jgi:hypothetical protein
MACQQVGCEKRRRKFQKPAALAVRFKQALHFRSQLRISHASAIEI